MGGWVGGFASQGKNGGRACTYILKLLQEEELAGLKSNGSAEAKKKKKNKGRKKRRKMQEEEGNEVRRRKVREKLEIWEHFLIFF